MKKLAFLFAATLFIGCSNPGEVQDYPVLLKFSGKTYKVKRVQIDENNYIHVVYPIDSISNQLPLQVVQQVSDGDDGTKPVTTVILK